MANQDMLINFVRGEECRIAIVEDGKLEELYTERTSADLHVGNIYRGRITNVEPSIQAAFVDFGLERSGFLHISDLHPRFFPGEDREQTERVGHKTPRRERPPIQQALKRGKMLPVQVLKEGIGTKGPTVSSYLSIPGRFLVMMPYMERHGVSRKIEDEEKRRQMRRILDELDPPENLGFIVRTAGFDRPKSELKRDLNYLLRLWKDIEKRLKKGRGPVELYAESDLIIRTLRDVITSDVKRIIVDDRVAALRAKQFLKLASPRTTTKVIHYKDHVPLFDAFDIERQIQQINSRTVPLDCGGSLVIDQTEAMVAVDVNSGKFRDKKDAEETAYLTNKDAIDEIARQLRLRDLGGLLVLDLIDMYANRHRRQIERQFRENLKKDRARTKVLKISELGLLEMTRQRMRPSLKKSVYNECPSCGGTGQVLSPESVALEVMRRIAVTLHANRVERVELKANPEVLAMLLNRRRLALAELEAKSGKPIRFTAEPSFGPDQVDLVCLDSHGNLIDLDRLPKPKTPRFGRDDELTIADLEELDEESRLVAYDDEEDEAESEGDTDEQPRARDKAEAEAEGDEDGKPRRKRRRRRRRRGGRGEDGDGDTSDAGPDRERADERRDDTEKDSDRGRPGERSRRDKRDKAPADKPVSGGYEGAPVGEKPVAKAAPGNVADTDDAGKNGEDNSEGEGGGGRKRRRRRRGGRRRRGRGRSGDENQQTDAQQSDGSQEHRESGGEGDEAPAGADERPVQLGRDRHDDKPHDHPQPAAEAEEQPIAGKEAAADPSSSPQQAEAVAESPDVSEAEPSPAPKAEGPTAEEPAAPVKRKRAPRRRKTKTSTSKTSGKAAATESEAVDSASAAMESAEDEQTTKAKADADAEKPAKPTKPARKPRSSRGTRRRSPATKNGDTTGDASANGKTKPPAADAEPAPAEAQASSAASDSSASDSGS